MQIKDYVKPELLVVAVVLYFIGMWLKQSETVKDKYIPLINGLIGVESCLSPEYSYTAMELLHRYKTSGSTAVARRRAVRFQPVCFLKQTNRYASTRVMM